MPVFPERNPRTLPVKVMLHAGAPNAPKRTFAVRMRPAKDCKTCPKEQPEQ